MRSKTQIEELKNIRIENFCYELPDERIAKFPLEERDKSKLLIYENGCVEEKCFSNVPDLLQSGQLLVFNDTKVIHARIFFKKESGANIEVFCLEPSVPRDYAQNFATYRECEWICLVGNLKKWKDGEIVTHFLYEGKEEILRAVKLNQVEGEVAVRFIWSVNISFSEVLELCGRLPIPPYLNRDSEDSDELRYQTVFSREEGSVAAPTAGLHFTKEILTDLKTQGVGVCGLTLHVGAGTFKPVKAEHIGGHGMHTEHIIVDRGLVERLLRQEKEIIAVGTTSVRTLESLYWIGVKLILGLQDFNMLGQWEAYELPDNYSYKEVMQAILMWFDTSGVSCLKAETTIMIVPSYEFKIIDAMFTNFHQPLSTLLLLVSAVVGDKWRSIYDYALDNDFRFLSYGDSSFLRIK